MPSTIEADLRALECQLAEFARVLKVKESDLTSQSLMAVFDRRLKGDWKDNSRCIGIVALHHVVAQLEKYRNFSPKALMEELQEGREQFNRFWAEDSEIKENDPVVRRRKRLMLQRRRRREEAAKAA
jgi:hypothetical protein